MTVSISTLQAERLTSFFINLGEISDKDGTNLATNVLRSPGRALEIGANVGIAFASRSPKKALSTLPEMINFFHTRKELHLPRFV